MIKKIFNRPELQDKPPVLIDIGASGMEHSAWQKIAPYSICISFDADRRKASFGVTEGGAFKKKYSINKIVSLHSGEQKFYLTKSPYCSSTLEPDSEALRPWYFSQLFNTESVIDVECIDLASCLKIANVDYIDWFKTDSQGTDLRLFKSLGDDLIRKITVAEFEPGIMPAYLGEDKLHHILGFMEKLPFWISDMRVLGTQRLSLSDGKKHLNSFLRRFLHVIMPKSPHWAEITYLNDFREIDKHTIRDILVGCVCGIVKNQFGFVMDLAQRGKDKFHDPIFDQILAYSIHSLEIRGLLIVPFVFKRMRQKFLHF